MVKARSEMHVVVSVEEWERFMQEHSIVGKRIKALRGTNELQTGDKMLEINGCIGLEFTDESRLDVGVLDGDAFLMGMNGLYDNAFRKTVWDYDGQEIVMVAPAFDELNHLEGFWIMFDNGAVVTFQHEKLGYLGVHAFRKR